MILRDKLINILLKTIDDRILYYESRLESAYMVGSDYTTRQLELIGELKLVRQGLEDAIVRLFSRPFFG